MNWVSLGVGVAGGLSLFLYGLYVLTEALKHAAGSAMKRILGRLTSNKFKGAFAGAFITSVIQSSSVTTVLVVGFISAGLMSLTESVGVIMGANIGTTITAQIIAFKVTKAAMVLIAVGGLSFVFAKKESWKNYSLIVLALGLIFFGMTVMSDATAPLRSYDPFIDFMQRMETPLSGILAGAIFTAVVQSSSATTGIIIVLATQGLVTLEAGIALAFGANIGTCVTAMLAAIGKPTEAVRAAFVHVLFNVAGVLIWIAFIDQLVDFVQWMSVDVRSTGAETAAERVPRQIANAHTVFNLANTFILIWFAHPIARLATYFVKDKPEASEPVLKAKYLDEVLISTPSLAMDRVRMELGRMGERVVAMIQKSADVVLEGRESELAKLEALDEEIDALFDQIAHYLGKVSAQALSKTEAADLSLYLSTANVLENMGDRVENRMVAAGYDVARIQEEFSVETRQKMRELILSVVPVVENALRAMDSQDVKLAKSVRREKARMNVLVRDLQGHLQERLIESGGERVRIFGIESEIVESSKRLYDLSKRIARAVIERKKEADRK